MLTAVTLGVSACSTSGDDTDPEGAASGLGAADPGQGAEEAETAEQNEKPTADGVEIVDYAFGSDEFTVESITLLKVVDDDLVGATIDIYVEFLDENGELIDEDWFFSTINWAQQEIAVAHYLGDYDEMSREVHSIAPRVELRPSEKDIDRGPQEPLPVLDHSAFSQDWSGETTVQFEVPAEALDGEIDRTIGIACYDANDALIGGTSSGIGYDEDITTIEEPLVLPGSAARCEGYMNYIWV
ncbi:MAG: hypothetical protein ACTH0E_09595 [Candidatus Microbacterium stercoravium]